MIVGQKSPSRFNGFVLHIPKPLRRLITFLPKYTGLRSGVSDIGMRSRPAEKLTGINIAGQSAMRNTAQIVNTSGIWAAIKARSSGALAKWESAGRRWAISFGLIGFDGCADKRTSRCARGRADRCTAYITSGGSADDRAGCRAITRPLTGWRIARSESQRGQSKPRNDCEMIFLHSPCVAQPCYDASVASQIQKFFNNWVRTRPAFSNLLRT